jgi:hypothetical protein
MEDGNKRPAPHPFMKTTEELLMIMSMHFPPILIPMAIAVLIYLVLCLALSLLLSMPLSLLCEV